MKAATLSSPENGSPPQTALRFTGNLQANVPLQETPIGLLDMMNVGNGHTALCMHIAHSSEQGAHGRAVIGIMAANDVLLLGFSRKAQ